MLLLCLAINADLTGDDIVENPVDSRRHWLFTEMLICGRLARPHLVRCCKRTSFGRRLPLRYDMWPQLLTLSFEEPPKSAIKKRRLVLAHLVKLHSAIKIPADVTCLPTEYANVKSLSRTQRFNRDLTSYDSLMHWIQALAETLYPD